MWCHSTGSFRPSSPQESPTAIWLWRLSSWPTTMGAQGCPSVQKTWRGRCSTAVLAAGVADRDLALEAQLVPDDDRRARLPERAEDLAGPVFNGPTLKFGQDFGR